MTTTTALSDGRRGRPRFAVGSQTRPPALRASGQEGRRYNDTGERRRQGCRRYEVHMQVPRYARDDSVRRTSRANRRHKNRPLALTYPRNASSVLVANSRTPAGGPSRLRASRRYKNQILIANPRLEFRL